MHIPFTLKRTLPVSRTKQAHISANSQLGAAGRYQFTVRKISTDIITRQTPWFTNLITNQGLERLGIGSPSTYCHVGTGTTEPAYTDTSLTTKIASTITVVSETYGNEITIPRYSWYRKTFRFNAGVAAGNLTEVGVGWGENSGLFSHSLIKDVNGTPIVVPVLSDEYLDVTFEFRIYPPSADASSTVILNGQEFTVLSRSAYVGDTGIWSAKNLCNYGASLHPSGIILAEAYSGDISADLTSGPTGLSSACATGVAEAYSAGSLVKDFTAYWSLNEGNVVGGIRSILIKTTLGTFQMRYGKTVGDTTIAKDNTYVLSLTHRIGWARRAS